MITKTFSADTTTPVRAYAALRAATPGRSSFLLESLGERRWGKRYSLVGHRARSETLFPGIGDVFPAIAADLPEPPVGGELAARFARALVGYVAYDAVHRIHGHEPWPDETDVARVMKDATVALFDHEAHTITVAGQSKGAVERCAWEMMRGPELEPLVMPTDALPAHVGAPWADGPFLTAARRAIESAQRGEVERVVLARTFIAGQRDADPLDIYRALRLLSPGETTYLVDFFETPFAPGLTLVGTASRELVATGPEGADRSLSAARAAFPAAEFVGVPAERSAALARTLEPMSRGPWGGAVGFFLGDGEVHLVPGTTTILLRTAELRVCAGTPVDGTTSPEAVLAATYEAARRPLRAIRVAHDLAEARAVELAKAREAAASAAPAEEA